jgi:hypothetical protein
MKKLIAYLKVCTFAATSLAKKIFKKEVTKPVHEDILFV